MPVKSAKQLKLMEAVKNGATYGPSKKVATEMLAKTSKKKKSYFGKEK